VDPVPVVAIVEGSLAAADFILEPGFPNQLDHSEIIRGRPDGEPVQVQFAE